jgi:hemoglobin
VHHFYDRVRDDELLGPVFAARIDDWEPHLARMCAFWSTVLRASGRYAGNPIEAHAGVPALDPTHFRRWLELFETSARATLNEAAAEDVHARAARMSRVLQRHHPDIPVGAVAGSGYPGRHPSR